jgi:exopolysaccharide biosynthesis WecB/TagA/CpsF family protein
MRAMIAQPDRDAAALHFAGLRLTPRTVEQSVSALAGRDAADPFAVYVTPNIEHIFLNRRRAELRAIYDGAFLSTNDSRILHRMARFAGLELEFAPGSYVTDRLFRGVIGPDDPITVIGGTAAVVETLKAQFGVRRLAQHIPPMGFIHDPAAVEAAVEFVARHPGRFVFVAMGPPQSELFCAKVIADGRSTGLGLCIGSSLNVITGQSDPAPAWMEQSGLVWLYRLVREPRRLWRRYLVNDMAGLALCARAVATSWLGRSSDGVRG